MTNSPPEPQHGGLSAALPQILGWVGAALVASAALNLVGQSWEDWSARTRLIVLLSALLVLVGPALGITVTSGGRERLGSQDTRRRIVAVLLALSAPLVAATAYQALELIGIDEFAPGQRAWALVPAITGLLAAVTGAWITRGVMTTLAVAAMWGFFGVTLLRIFGEVPAWVFPVIIALIGAVWLSVAPRILTPIPLVEALGVAWLIALLAPVSLMETWEASEVGEALATEEFVAAWTARALLITFAAVCFLVFSRSGGWSWATGGVIAAALAALAIAGSALGWITGMLVAGVVLLGVSGLLLLFRRSRQSSPNTSAPVG
jgi:hypothetical protein